MNITKVSLSVLAILVGVFIIIYGGYDDSPGAQLLGLVVAITGGAGVYKNWRRK